VQPHDGMKAPIKRGRDRSVSPWARTEQRPHEDAARREPSATHGVGPPQMLNLPAP
jgi:hypothetical protein